MQQSLSAAELYATVFDDELMLVKPFMPAGGHCMLHGKRGLGKTQIAHTLAIDVALGLPFLGAYETTQSRVFYIQADMPIQLQQDRLRRIVDNTGIDLAIPLRYKCFPGAFDCGHELERGSPWIAELQSFDPGLVIVDTLRKSHVMDENVSNTPVEIYSIWRAICGPRATILYLHHDRKTSEWSAGGDRDEDFRGSGAWLDEADLGMHLCKTKAGLHLEWSKLRTCGPDDVRTVALQIDPHSLLTVPDDPVEAYIRDAIIRQQPKALIVAAATDRKRWGAHALSKTTVYERLAGYTGPAR